jgi:hypothetical protein
MGPQGTCVSFKFTRRFCNLRCLHCYSSSGPDLRAQLDPELIRDALEDAAELGYNVVGFSGGEPLRYEPLSQLLRFARRLGMATTVTSNGTTLTTRRLELLSGHTSLLAIRLDGIPESHNIIRSSTRAFETMAGSYRVTERQKPLVSRVQTAGPGNRRLCSICPRVFRDATCRMECAHYLVPHLCRCRARCLGTHERSIILQGQGEPAPCAADTALPPDGSPSDYRQDIKDVRVILR